MLIKAVTALLCFRSTAKPKVQRSDAHDGCDILSWTDRSPATGAEAAMTHARRNWLLAGLLAALAAVGYYFLTQSRLNLQDESQKGKKDIRQDFHPRGGVD